MRVGIDVQTLETYERTRGIGRLCAGTIAALHAHYPDMEITLFGAGAFAPSALPASAAKLRYARINPGGGVAEHLRLGCAAPFLWTTPEARGLDVYHVTSPLMPDILLPSPGPCAVVATLLDAIPAVMSARGTPTHDEAAMVRYRVRANVVRRYQHFLPISQSAADDCARHLDLPVERMTVSHVPVGQGGGGAGALSVLKPLGIKPGYVIAVTGYHPRKNLRGTLAAYAGMPPELRKRSPLVLVCHLDDGERAEVEAQARGLGISRQLVLTGFVTDDELAALLFHADAMLFLSRYEGFGIPAAEAMAAGLPVVASATSSLPEVCGDAGVLVDPDDAQAAADALAGLLASDEVRRRHAALGREQAEKFAPERHAEKVLSAYRRALEGCTIHESPSVSAEGALRIAVFSPLPPRMSGIADYTEHLLLNLGDDIRADCFTEAYPPSNPRLRERCSSFEFPEFARRHAAQPYDAVLHQVGNNIQHAYSLPFAERVPGVSVLHDYSLLGLHRLVGQQYGERRTQQMRFADEYPAEAPDVWEDDLRLDALAYEDYPMTGPILQGSRAVVVHSAWLRDRVRSHAPAGLRVEHIPMGVDFAVADAPRPSREELRRRYLLPPDAFVVASVGVINRLKRLDIVLEAFEEFHRTCPESRFVLVGPADRAVLRRMVGLCRSRRILHAVRFLGHRDIADLNDVIAMADVCVNLRYPTMGESSATLAAILAMGRPALVTPIGQFQEFPDDVCWKVRLGVGEKLEMVEYFRCLRAQPEVARELGSNARKFVEGWGWPQVARRYAELLAQVARDARA